MRSLLSQPAVGPQAEEPEEEAGVEGGEGELALSSCYESAADELLSDGDDELVATTTTKGLYGEENIWEQISAIRTIVGYKNSRRSSYIDEIRDLYVFTGIQPPLSFKDSSDFREIDEKLQCLKSVVGIK
ncbi:uncharacterized protein LOC109835993 [Asparagus officinalis]|nr:uncharacterized protein LOC109835993 [Asparagus officinalis]